MATASYPEVTFTIFIRDNSHEYIIDGNTITKCIYSINNSRVTFVFVNVVCIDVFSSSWT